MQVLKYDCSSRSLITGRVVDPPQGQGIAGDEDGDSDEEGVQVPTLQLKHILRTFDRVVDKVILPAYMKPGAIRLYDGDQRAKNLNPHGKGRGLWGMELDRKVWVELHKYHLRVNTKYKELWERYSKSM